MAGGARSGSARHVLVPDLDHAVRLAADDPDVRRTLAVVADPEVRCTVDVSVRTESCRDGWVQLHSRQGLRNGLVGALSSVGGTVEIGWWPVDHWQVELSRVATVSLADAPCDERHPTSAVAPWEVPLDVLLGTAEALRGGREDLFDEIVSRAVGLSRTAPLDQSDPPIGGQPLDADGIRRRLLDLHRGAVGRLRATVAGAQGHRLGWVSWVLGNDGWRELCPVSGGGEPLVRITRVRPLDLGVRVAGLVVGVRDRSGRATREGES